MKDKTCISCRHPLPDDIVIIGDQYPSAVFVDDETEKFEAASLNVTKCKQCGLVQLSSHYDLQYVFDHYPYESSSTATMKAILQDIVDDAKQITPLKETDVVLDIGGNDGTLLDLLGQPVQARVNIDAAAGVKQVVDSPDYTHIHGKFSSEIYKKLNLPNPKLIFSVAMFYHLSDPHTFCENVRDIMDDDSVWVLQMTYLGTMLKDNIFDNIVHEHAAYYSLESLEYLLSLVGLKIAEARIVQSYGGSLRVFIVKDEAKFNPQYYRKDYVGIQQWEIEHNTNTYEELYAFNSRVQLLCKSLKSLLDHITQTHGRIWGFGASTKGNMILQCLGANSSQISCILDNSSKKIGKKTIGTNIPILDESIYLHSLPGYLLVLPYYYTSTFVKIIKKYLKSGEKVHLLVPLPHPYFITLTGE